MKTIIPEDEQLLLIRLSDGDNRALAEIYSLYASSLVTYANSKVRNIDAARDVVHDLFTQLWIKRSSIDIKQSLKSFLFTSIKYRVVDHIRKNIVRAEYISSLRSLTSNSNNVESALYQKEIIENVNKVVETLSPKVKLVYKMSRDSHMSIADIAKQLNVSEQTVKNQLTLALKCLRSSLAKFMALAFMFLLK